MTAGNKAHLYFSHNCFARQYFCENYILMVPGVIKTHLGNRIHILGIFSLSLVVYILIQLYRGRIMINLKARAFIFRFVSF